MLMPQEKTSALSEFPPAVIREVNGLALTDEVFEARTEVIGVTVDGPQAKDLDDAINIAQNEEDDLFAPLPHAKDYNIFRELLLIADHNAYHIGQLILINKISV